MSCPVNLPTGSSNVGEEAASARVNIKACEERNALEVLIGHRFMADKIMPLSEAVEGYDLFDNMKAQKVIFKAQE